VKRRRKLRKSDAGDGTTRNHRVRHHGSKVDDETVAWVEAGLDRVQAEDDVKRNVLLKWKDFLRQHVMQAIEQVKQLIN
jgi:hypothetical protein